MQVGYKELFLYFKTTVEDKVLKEITIHDLSLNAVLAYNSFKKHDKVDLNRLYESTLKYSTPKREGKIKVFYSPFFEYTMFFRAATLVLNRKRKLEEKLGIKFDSETFSEYQSLFFNNNVRDEVFGKTWVELLEDIFYRTKYYFDSYEEKTFSLEEIEGEINANRELALITLEKIVTQKVDYERIHYLFLEAMYYNIIFSNNEREIFLEVTRDLKILSNRSV